MSKSDLSWSIPFMRAGYAGRGLTYLAIAGLSLWALWRGGQAQGTQSALESLSRAPGGIVAIALICGGLLAYMIWRVVDAGWDLEAHGNDAKGITARIGMVVTGLIHGALGVAALLIVIGTGSGGDGSSIASMTADVLAQPFGRWMVGLGGLATIAAAIYYLHKAWTESYHAHLQANPATLRLNPALKAGVAAQGVVVGIIGGFLVVAALQADASEAGGLGQVFDWLRQQAFGNIIVVALCVGLLGFALFCFTNAAYRVIPRVAGDDLVTLGQKLKAQTTG